MSCIVVNLICIAAYSAPLANQSALLFCLVLTSCSCCHGCGMAGWCRSRRTSALKLRLQRAFSCCAPVPMQQRKRQLLQSVPLVCLCGRGVSVASRCVRYACTLSNCTACMREAAACCCCSCQLPAGVLLNSRVLLSCLKWCCSCRCAVCMLPPQLLMHVVDCGVDGATVNWPSQADQAIQQHAAAGGR